MQNKKQCVHDFELAGWQYKRTVEDFNGTPMLSGAPTHTLAYVFFCKKCLKVKIVDEDFYKDKNNQIE